MTSAQFFATQFTPGSFGTLFAHCGDGETVVLILQASFFSYDKIITLFSDPFSRLSLDQSLSK